MASNETLAAGEAPRVNKLYFAVWRWHFYAGLFVIPFLMMLVITGATMMLYAGIGNTLGQAGPVAAPERPLAVSALIEAAVAAVPEGKADQYVAPESPTSPAYVIVKAGEAAMSVAVDPGTGAVLSVVDKTRTVYAWASDIHGTLLLGDFGDRVIEVAASLTVILIVTGAYLWWPRGQGRALAPNLAAKGRGWWKEIHRVLGAWSAVVLLGFCLSGLAWAGIWGGKFVQPWSSFPAEKSAKAHVSGGGAAPAQPAATGHAAMGHGTPAAEPVQTHASMNHGPVKDVPWAMEQVPMPVSEGQGPAAIAPVDADGVAAWAQAEGYRGQYKITLPKGETGVLTFAAEGRNEDGVIPSRDRTVHFDRFSGAKLADVGYADYSLVAKAMAWGIGLHKGLTGTWNFVFNLVFLAAVTALCASGLVMWLKRRPTGATRLAAPPLPQDVPLAKGVVLLAVALSMAFPMAGLTLLAVLAVDFLLLARLPALRRLAS